MNLYEPTIGVFGRGLNGLDTLRAKAVAFGKDKGMNEGDILGWRLYPDMFPLYSQFQIICDFARLAPARIVGAKVPEAIFSGPLSDPTSFETLENHISNAKAYIAEFTADQFEGRETAEITFPIGDQEMTTTAAQYLFGFATQNYFFHLVTAYNILRNIGVPLGKRAYFGQPD